jgi:hypothetical protein
MFTCSSKPKPCVPQPGTCVYYSGNAITGPNIQSGDNFNVVVSKLNTYINSLGVNVTGQNLGVSGAGIFAQKSGNFLQFKRIVAGANVTITENSTSITIQASGSGGGSGDGGITSINGLTGLTQTFSAGSSGTDFVISSVGSVHSFNLPIASAVNTGKLSSADWSTFNSKVGTGVNLGAGQAVYKQKVGTNLEFRTLRVLGGLAISSDANEITIDASAIGSSGEANTGSNLSGTGGRIFVGKVGVDFQFRRVNVGAGLSVSEGTNEVVITNTSPDQVVALTAGANIAVTGTYPNFTIAATGVGETNTASNLGSTGARVFSTKVGVDLRFRRLVAGANVTITEGTDDITISSTGGGGGADGNNFPTTLALSAGVLTLGRSGLSALTTNVSTTDVTEGTNLYFNNTRARAALSGGTGINYNSTTGVITNSAPDQTVTITGGTNITVVGTYPSFTISAAASGETNTGSNLGASGSRVFSGKVGVDLQFRRIISGLGITVTENTNDISIVNSAPDQTVVLNAGSNVTVGGTYPNFTISASGEANTASNLGATGGRVFSAKTGVDLQFRRIVGGTNITVNETADSITINASGGASGEANTGSNLGATGAQVFSGKVGVDLQFRRLVAGPNVVLTENTNDVTIEANIAPQVTFLTGNLFS